MTPEARHFDFASLSAPERYKLLTAVVVLGCVVITQRARS